MNSARLALMSVLVVGVVMSGIAISYSDADAVVICQRKGKIRLRPQNCKTNELSIGTLPQTPCCQGEARRGGSARPAAAEESKGDELVTADFDELSSQVVQLEDRISALESLHDEIEEVRPCSRSSAPECSGTCPAGLTCGQDPFGVACACQLGGFLIESATTTTSTTSTTTTLP